MLGRHFMTTLHNLPANSADDKLMIFFLFFFFPQKTDFNISCKLSPPETICKKCQNLFSGKNISICRLLKILPRMLSVKSHITKTRLFKYIENFATKKKTKTKFSDKNSNTFHISAQNIDCGYSLEPPRRPDRLQTDCVYSLEPPRRC